ncbi:High mobility group B protein 13 [Camellia lanceoleosa]|uniref:High mobility group B protein 13 n=1 Tax=Camellia lanceoleosa TaxID=1840588 RepID=A0ACC0FP64_9ERIC|nr:High mobility group B protein 13 [Camellia lanceoleosa]
MYEDVTERVLDREMQWLDFGYGVDAIGREIEKLLIDDLIVEVANMKEKDLLKPKQPMSAFFMFRNEQRAESKSGWEVIEEWNNMTEKQKKPYEKIAKQSMEKYLEEMEAYKQRKEEESANPKKEEDEMMKIHKQEALELLKKKEKRKENR